MTDEQTPERKRVRRPNKGYRLRELHGRLVGEIRSRRYGYWSHQFAPGTKSSDAHKACAQQLRDMSLRNVNTVEHRILKDITLEGLISQARNMTIVFGKWSENDNDIVAAFLRNDKQIASKSLADITPQDLIAHINRCKKDNIVHYTITRMRAPIRTIYRNAVINDLYGLVKGFSGKLPNPFDNPLVKKALSRDDSGRERFLKPEDDLTIYAAIEKQCRTKLTKHRMILLVHLALTTALRRGVLLKLKWEDIDFDNQVIRIKKTYFTPRKPAPPMVPITSQLEKELRTFYKILPDVERQPTCKLFANMHERKHMYLPDIIGSHIEPHIGLADRLAKQRHKTYQQMATELHSRGQFLKAVEDRKPSRPEKEGNTRWCDDVWNRIVRRTDLFEFDESGEKDWPTFHDLRHTAVTRYRNKPYRLQPEQYDYLLGKFKHRYAHLNLVEWCEDIRTAIETGDAELRKIQGLTPRDIVTSLIRQLSPSLVG